MIVSELSNSPSNLCEIGKIYAERCDLKEAFQVYLRASELALKEKNYAVYLKAISQLLRIHAERDENSEIEKIKEQLQELSSTQGFELDSKTLYTLGLCASYRGQNKTALEYLEKALAMALANDDKENVCYAIAGISIVYFGLKRYDDALKEIYNLQVFFQVMPLPDIRISTLILNGHVLRELGKYDQALEIFWRCYDELKTQKNLYLYLYLLFALGITYKQAGQDAVGEMYLVLARRTVDRDNLPMLAKRIDKRLGQAPTMKLSEYDLVFDTLNKQVTEKKKGKVDFNNQFILLDLLRMFVKAPGEVFSKENIVEIVWKQNYDPTVHDNKLYVTIKRLRKLIEPDYEKPKYIFRAKNGYYLNKNARVLIQK